MKQLHVFAFLVLLTVRCSAPATNNQTTETLAANDQPDMTITLLDGTPRNIKSLDGKNVLIFFFPDCDHCQREATEIEKKLDAFKDNTLYFIAAAPPNELQAFADQYKLSGHSNVYFASVPAKSILDHYGPIDAPSIYIYSAEHKLVKSFNGETLVDMVLSYL